ncbi:type II secretion system protein [Tumebacillus sp. DT12]|uniref:Type II secretion system protein n=1 Tax=Tumebacillus lacus TaxID=2995335 RepID=A0ABT3X5Z4_9BACL|nr:type II secretion system protein [Tumebacillus lacus]MCX7571392.1 type II secretion system protein [Tumebacillus lacus]
MSLIRKLKNRIKNQRGVTLIELLAVIVILGVIAAVGIPAVVNSRADAEQATYEANAKIISEAIKKRILFGEAYDGASDAGNTTDRVFSIPEIATELGITNLSGVTAGTGSTVTVNANRNDGSAAGTYTIDTASGVVAYEISK